MTMLQDIKIGYRRYRARRAYRHARRWYSVARQAERAGRDWIGYYLAAYGLHREAREYRALTRERS